MYRSYIPSPVDFEIRMYIAIMRKQAGSRTCSPAIMLRPSPFPSPSPAL